MAEALPQRHLLALMAGIFAVGSEELVVSPLLAGIAEALDTSISAAGLSVAVYGLATAVGAAAFAFLGDRLDRRSNLLAATGLFVAGTVCSALAPTLEVLLCGRALAGLATGVFVPAAYAFVGDRIAFEDRARAMGRVVSAWSISLVLGVPMGAAIGGLLGWRPVFWILAAVGAVVGALLATAPAEPNASSETSGAPSEGPIWPRPPAARHVKVMLIVTFLNMLGFYGLYTYIGATLHERFNEDAWLVGALILVYGVGFATVSFTGKSADRLGKMPVLIGLLVGLALVMAGLPLAMRWAPALAVALFLWGTMQGLTVTLLSTVLSEAAPERRGAVMALYSLAVNLAVAIGAAALGPVYESGFDALTWACGGATLIAAVLAALQRRELPVAPLPRTKEESVSVLRNTSATE